MASKEAVCPHWAFTSDNFLLEHLPECYKRLPQYTLYMRTSADEILGYEVLDAQPNSMRLIQKERWVKQSDGVWLSAGFKPIEVRVPGKKEPIIITEPTAFAFKHGDQDPLSLDLQLLQELDWKEVERLRKRTDKISSNADRHFACWLDPVKFLEEEYQKAKAQKQADEEREHRRSALQTVAVLPAKKMPNKKRKIALPEEPSTHAEELAKAGEFNRPQRQNKVTQRQGEKVRGSQKSHKPVLSQEEQEKLRVERCKKEQCAKTEMLKRFALRLGETPLTDEEQIRHKLKQALAKIKALRESKGSKTNRAHWKEEAAYHKYALRVLQGKPVQTEAQPIVSRKKKPEILLTESKQVAITPPDPLDQELEATAHRTMEVHGEKVPVVCREGTGSVYRGDLTHRRLKKRQAREKTETHGGFRSHHTKRVVRERVLKPTVELLAQGKKLWHESPLSVGGGFQKPFTKKKASKAKPTKQQKVKPASKKKPSHAVRLTERAKKLRLQKKHLQQHSPGEKFVRQEILDVRRLRNKTEQRIIAARKSGDLESVKRLETELRKWQERLKLLSQVLIPPEDRGAWTVFSSGGAPAANDHELDDFYGLQDELITSERPQGHGGNGRSRRNQQQHAA